MKKIALTMGDPAGIGPEIIAMLFKSAETQSNGSTEVMRQVVVYGDVTVMQRAAKLVGTDIKHIPIVQTGTPFTAATLPSFGAIHAQSGLAAARSVEAAAHAVLRGEAMALVTAPLHKEALALAGIGHPGHTEMLQALCARHLGVAVDELPVRMMLANDELRTALVSIHLPLRLAIDNLRIEGILQTIEITHHFLVRCGVQNPRIAVAGVNPHAGESGLFGQEEEAVILPAVKAAVARGMNVSGPFAPDTVFMRARRTKTQNEFDVVVAMYHDQGLIPIKYGGLEAGVNVTLGLPLIRTSPDHGTAFDIAGTKKADPRGLLYAINKAHEFTGY